MWSYYIIKCYHHPTHHQSCCPCCCVQWSDSLPVSYLKSYFQELHWYHCLSLRSTSKIGEWHKGLLWDSDAREQERMISETEAKQGEDKPNSEMYCIAAHCFENKPFFPPYQGHGPRIIYFWNNGRSTGRWFFALTLRLLGYAYVTAEYLQQHLPLCLQGSECFRINVVKIWMEVKQR